MEVLGWDHTANISTATRKLSKEEVMKTNCTAGQYTGTMSQCQAT